MALRVLGGVLRGSVLQVQGDFRPCMAWSRGVMWNWLGHDLGGQHVLDACAGSGILTLEALSFGAASVEALDQDLASLEVMRLRFPKLQDRLRVRSHRWPRAWKVREPYDVIFWDPPYDAPWRHEVWSLAQQGGWLEQGVLMRWARTGDRADVRGWRLIKERKRGGTVLECWQRDG